MTAGAPRPGTPADFFEIGKEASTRMRNGSFVGLLLGIICLVATVVAAVGDESVPAAGVAVFAVLSVLFIAIGAVLLTGATSSIRNAHRWGPRRLRVDDDGFCELGLSQGPVFVPWSAFEAFDIVATSPGGGYNPYSTTERKNSPVSMGLTTVIRMNPVDPAEFASRAPLFVVAAGSRTEQMVRWPFGRAYYTEFEIRYELVDAVRRHTGGRLGQPIDETQRARYHGSQFPRR